MMIAWYRRKPALIEAARWEGGDTEWLDQWLGQNWTRADARDIVWEHGDEEQLVIWNSLEKSWNTVPVKHWILRGIAGNFYPCDPQVFSILYEETDVLE
jgi:hypothetical protein